MEKILRETPISPLEEHAAKLPAGTKPLFFGDAVPGWKERLEAFYGENILFGAEDRGGIRGEALHRLTAAAPASAYTADPMPVYLRGVELAGPQRVAEGPLVGHSECGQTCGALRGLRAGIEDILFICIAEPPHGSRVSVAVRGPRPSEELLFALAEILVAVVDLI